MLFALALLAAGIWRRIVDLRIQSYIIAALAFLGSLSNDLWPSVFGTTRERWIILALSVAALYAAQVLAHRIEPPQLCAEKQAPAYFSLLGTLLLTFVLYQEVSGSLLTMAWGILGLLLLAVGFPARERILRLQGLALFLVCILKLFVYDLRNLETLYRILSFITLGLILLGVSWIYTRFRDRIRQFLYMLRPRDCDRAAGILHRAIASTGEHNVEGPVLEHTRELSLTFRNSQRLLRIVPVELNRRIDALLVVVVVVLVLVEREVAIRAGINAQLDRDRRASPLHTRSPAPSAQSIQRAQTAAAIERRRRPQSRLPPSSSAPLQKSYQVAFGRYSRPAGRPLLRHRTHQDRRPEQELIADILRPRHQSRKSITSGRIGV